ncbi:hypothetical protein Tco_0193679 [Tanacetum coccineum]
MLESLRGHFFNGHEIGSNKATWVKWEKVLTAKDKGGLGVASLYALIGFIGLIWLFGGFKQPKIVSWKKVIQAIHGRDGNVHSINKSAVHSCWTTIVKEIRRLGVSGLNIFDFMKQKVGNGNIIKFWTDNWYHGGILKDIYPRLYVLENQGVVSWNSSRCSLICIDHHHFGSIRNRGLELEAGEFSVASIRRKIDDSRLPTIGDKTRSGLPEVTHRDIVEAEREISEKEKAPSGILYLAAGYYLKGWIYSYDQDGVVANLSDGEVKALFRLAYEKAKVSQKSLQGWYPIIYRALSRYTRGVLRVSVIFNILNF